MITYSESGEIKTIDMPEAALSMRELPRELAVRCVPFTVGRTTIVSNATVIGSTVLDGQDEALALGTLFILYSYFIDIISSFCGSIAQVY